MSILESTPKTRNAEKEKEKRFDEALQERLHPEASPWRQWKFEMQR